MISFRAQASSAIIRFSEPLTIEVVLTNIGSDQSVLLTEFASRSQPERLAALSDSAGNSDARFLELVKRGLSDTNAAVQRTALLRLLAFPAANALDALSANEPMILPELRAAAAAVRAELGNRQAFPFLRFGTNNAQAFLSELPSQNGSAPRVSPDRQWIAYVEGGYGRPGGSGGFGGSNYRTLVHVMRSDGNEDRIVSDMFLIGWLADNQRIASARGEHASINDLRGKVLADFGNEPAGATNGDPNSNDWTKGQLREQIGTLMPHRKTLRGVAGFGYGIDVAISPDGKWVGPAISAQGVRFLGQDGRNWEMKWPADLPAT